MAKKNKRPVFLNLFKIRLPITGVVSIAHRITGVLLVLALPFIIGFLQRSLAGPRDYDAVRAVLSSPPAKIALIVVFWIFLQHFFSGIRHLFLSISVGVDAGAARLSAWLCFVLSIAGTGWFALALA